VICSSLRLENFKLLMGSEVNYKKKIATISSFTFQVFSFKSGGKGGGFQEIRHTFLSPCAMRRPVTPAPIITTCISFC